MKLARRTIAVITAVILAATAISIASISPMAEQTITDLKEPRLLIRKSARALEIYDGVKLVKTYRIVLGFSPDLDKEVEGDGRTPQGKFYVFTKNPKSRFHLSLGLSYPAPDDAERGHAGGLITHEERDAIIKANAEREMPPQKTRLGGEIYIHGGGTANDWTDGCIALDNEEMTELFGAIPVGTEVTIEV